MPKLFKVYSLCLVASVLSCVGCGGKKEADGKVSSQSGASDVPQSDQLAPPPPKF